ncbi:MAG: hypothetical protein R3C14_43830 [Caldilineaceae bacterium]
MSQQVKHNVMYTTLFWSWLGAHLVGGAVAGILEERLQFLGTLVLVGLCIGLVQGIVLWRVITHPIWWALILVLGWPLSNLLWLSTRDGYQFLVNALIATGWLWEVFWLNATRIPIILAPLAIVQALVGLRGWRTRLLWVVLNIIGGVVVGGLGATVCRSYCTPLAQWGGAVAVGAVLGGVSWLGYGLVTAWVLGRLGVDAGRV